MKYFLYKLLLQICSMNRNDTRDQDHTRFWCGCADRTTTAFFKCGIVHTRTPPPQFICMLFFNIFKKILESF